MSNTVYIKLFIVSLMLYTVYEFLRLSGWFKSNVSENIAKSTFAEQRREELYKKHQQSALNFIKVVGTSLYANLSKNHMKYDLLTNSLKRMQIKIFDKVLDIYEFKGLAVGLLGASIVASLLLYLMNMFIILIPILISAGIFICFFSQILFDMLITEKDKKLTTQFSDFFLMVYSAIVSMSGSMLIDVVKAHTVVLEYRMTSNVKTSKILSEIFQLTKTYLAFLSQYDELTATRKLKDRYCTSAMIVNFCALVEQRLLGVNNIERLLSFKASLLQKKKQIIKDKSVKICEKGTYIIKLIYLILIQTVIIASIANLPFMVNYIGK